MWVIEQCAELFLFYFWFWTIGKTVKIIGFHNNTRLLDHSRLDMSSWGIFQPCQTCKIGRFAKRFNNF